MFGPTQSGPRLLSASTIISHSNNDDQPLIKQFWVLYLKDAPVISTTNIDNNPVSNKETFTPEFHEPLLPGVWKQSFLLDLVAEDQDKIEESYSEDENVDSPKNQLEMHSNNQEDTFLAELSQMF
ncbi:hypothetical protein WDU94_002670 [Cyamophila willieti]